MFSSPFATWSNLKHAHTQKAAPEEKKSVVRNPEPVLCFRLAEHYTTAGQANRAGQAGKQNNNKPQNLNRLVVEESKTLIPKS